MRILSVLFGARAQVVVGAVAFVVAALYWALGPRTVASVFHVSMAFGLVACYAILATGLGYRATERVEQIVDPYKPHPDETQ